MPMSERRLKIRFHLWEVLALLSDQTLSLDMDEQLNEEMNVLLCTVLWERAGWVVSSDYFQVMGFVLVK